MNMDPHLSGAITGSPFCASLGYIGPPSKIEQVTVHPDRVEIVRRYPSGGMYACYPPHPMPDTIEKEIYRIVDGKLVLSEKKQGKHTPAHTVEEQITFE